MFLLGISGSPPGLRRQRHASWASPPDAHPMVDDARVDQNPMFLSHENRRVTMVHRINSDYHLVLLRLNFLAW